MADKRRTKGNGKEVAPGSAEVAAATSPEQPTPEKGSGKVSTSGSEQD